MFVWTAAVLQLLLLFDPRYRDFPLPAFAVPLVVRGGARGLAGDLPRDGGGREEVWAGGVLAARRRRERRRARGRPNLQSLVWSAAALVLAAPPLLRAALAACRRARVIQAQAPSAAPSIPQVAL